MKNFADDMKNKITGYPGHYKPPLFILDEEISELNTKETGSVLPVTNISETRDYVKVEMTVPGHKREDFIASINNNKLLIIVLSKKFSGIEESKKQELNYNCFSHSIDLPEYIDTDFVKAEYKSGIITFYFPKVKTPTLNTVKQVVIY